MFASNRPAGSVASAWETQATHQMLQWPSPVSKRPTLPRRGAMGQVKAVVSTTASAAIAVPRASRGRALVEA